MDNWTPMTLRQAPDGKPVPRVYKWSNRWWATLDGRAHMGTSDGSFASWQSAMRLSLPFEEYERRYGSVEAKA